MFELKLHSGSVCLFFLIFEPGPPLTRDFQHPLNPFSQEHINEDSILSLLRKSIIFAFLHDYLKKSCVDTKLL